MFRPSFPWHWIPFALILCALVATLAANYLPGPRPSVQSNAHRANCGNAESRDNNSQADTSACGKIEQAPNHDAGSQGKTPNTPNGQSDTWSTYNTLQLFATIASAVAAVFMAWFTCKLYGVTAELHIAAQAAEEPLLLISDPTPIEERVHSNIIELLHETRLLEQSIQGAIEITVRLQIKNHGKGVAKIARCAARAHLSEDRMYQYTSLKMPIVNRFRTLPFSFASQAISASDQSQGFIFRTVISDPVFAAITASQIRLRFLVFIAYSDVLGREYRRKFRLSYVPPALNITGESPTRQGFMYLEAEPTKSKQKKDTKNASLSNPE